MIKDMSDEHYWDKVELLCAYLRGEKTLDQVMDTIEPNPSHLNNLYAITKAKRSNLQERSNNQENEPHAPTQ